ncbi:MAG TPA: phosphotransferase family protein [Rhizomicrobium sp.]|nr:phosphotransferase family protein [Rhizomicrobium sp.]
MIVDASSSAIVTERALNAIAGRIVAGASAVTSLRQLSGGASQELWRFEVVNNDRSIPAILRRAPGGVRVSPVAVGPETEARLMSAAGARGVPAPPVLYVLAPEDGLGRGFVAGFVEGETLGGRIVKIEALASARAVLARQCGQILARIHALDANEFSDLRRFTPPELLDEWQAAYRATETPRPVFELAFRWLRANCPNPPERPRLVHGDFRNGNLIVGPDGVRAVLDWELAHVGDPMEDLGWLCVNSWRFGAMEKIVGGFGELVDLFAGYEAEGAAADFASIGWWEIFGTLRWGVMCAGMPRAFGEFDRTVERAVIARRASETEIDLMRLLTAHPAH